MGTIGSATKKKVTDITVDIQTGTDRTVFATWKWDVSNTDHYRVKWTYYTGDGVQFVGSESDVSVKQSTYTAPSNATKVKFTVKAVSKTKKVNGKKVNYWTTSWSTAKAYSFSSNPPSTPPTPNVEIEGYKLTASLSNLDVNADTIEFQIVKNDNTVFGSGTASIKTKAASYSCYVTAGCEYKVRARAVKSLKKEQSGWSEYSSNVGTPPTQPTKISTCKATSETSAYLDWAKVANATSYEIRYTTQKIYFDSSNEVSSMTVEAPICHAEVTGLETGNTYFFQVRAINDEGESAWTSIASTIVGKVPSAPTTWSSSTTLVSGEPLTLYWVHNSEDGSSQTYAELEIEIDGNKSVKTIKNSTAEDEKDKTSSYQLDSTTSDGSTIKWRVRTKGILPDYGEWSILRTIDVYAPPTLELVVTDSKGIVSDWHMLETVESFPIYIAAIAGPNNQTPISYHLTVISTESYETVDQAGNEKIVNQNEAVYSKHFDTSEQLLVQLSAGNVDLENNVGYKVVCTVSMDSGLTAESSVEFDVAWTDEEVVPNAEIGIDEETLTAYIRPYCTDENDNLIDDISLSVYRREFDGTFTEIMTGIDNTSNTYVTDPHPALDYARYRVVAIVNSTGAVSYYDVPGYPIGEKAVVIQWDEDWSDFSSTDEDEYEQPAYAGKMLKLPYNIDVSDNNDSDVELVKYTGRKHPVSYYGTQVGQSSTWNVDIEKSDTDTLYMLRCLSIYMGDVYVREPSGSGYWANVKVSFSQKHCELTIPVTFDITRVEGGI